MRADSAYTLADPEFYEDASRHRGSSTFEEIVRRHLPAAGWETNRQTIWLHVRRPEVALPQQGFKIHVSSTPECATAVLARMVALCVQHGVCFKCAATPAIHDMLNSKPYGRGGAGKFMTIYPVDRAAFVDLIERFHEATGHEPFKGPYILSDRRYKDSPILYYRYGGIRPPRRLELDGTFSSHLTAPDGTATADERLGYFRLPPWVDDPFGGSREIEAPSGLVLGERFVVESMISVTNRGGVYIGTDTHTGDSVIIKEARPYVNRSVRAGRVVDSTTLLEHEHHVLTRIAATGCAPRPIALFDEWEHKFLVEERIDGVSLHRWTPLMENLVLPYILRDGVLLAFLPKFHCIAAALFGVVDRIHAEGVLIGDLSHGNIIVTPDLARVTLIDLETAIIEDEDDGLIAFAGAWATPGFASRERRDGRRITRRDDHYALGMALFGLFVGGLQFFDLHADALPRFLARLRALGVPADIAAAIEALWAGRADEARTLLLASAERASVNTLGDLTCVS